MSEQNPAVILNVGGIKYETYRSTLLAYPNTLLGTMFNPRNQELLKSVNGNEYFFDRNGYAFQYILEFYRTGKIHWPNTYEENRQDRPRQQEQEQQQQQQSNNNNNNSLQKITNKQLEIELDYFQINLSEEMKLDISIEAGGKELDSFLIMLNSIIYYCIENLLFCDLRFYFYDDGQEPYIKFGNNLPYIESELKKFQHNGYYILEIFEDEIKLYIEKNFINLKFCVDYEYHTGNDGKNKWGRCGGISNFESFKEEILNHSILKESK